MRSVSRRTGLIPLGSSITSLVVPALVPVVLPADPCIRALPGLRQHLAERLPQRGGLDEIDRT